MEMDSLAGLGVSVRSQENLESEVMDKLEERMKQQEKETTVKQVKKEFPLLIQKLKICLKKKRSLNWLIELEIQGCIYLTCLEMGHAFITRSSVL